MSAQHEIGAVSLPKTLPIKSRTERLYGLDWLRAICAIFVVMLHAAIPYMSNPLPGLKWSIDPPERSEIVNLIGWGIDGFIMPIFFLMNGFFASRLLQQRGSRAFVKHRLARIGGPFLFGLIFILPMDLYVWLLGWVNAGLIPIQKMRSLKIRGELGNSLHGVSHLWFLEYVLVYCLLACLLTWIFRQMRTRPDDQFKLSRSQPHFAIRWGTLGLAVAISGILLWLQPRIVIGFRHGWIPFWENLAFYAVPFALGWFWEQHSPRFMSTAANHPWQVRRWGLRLALAGLAFMFLWPELKSHLTHESIPATRAQMPFLFAGFSVLMSTGLLGGALSLPLTRIPAAIGYLSKASFWIYLIHHPLVGLAQVDLTFVKAPPLVKFLLVTLITLSACLLSYEGLVRTTWLGQLLNGVREQPRRRTIPVEAIPLPAERRAA